jgi:2-polyprenyl-6-methoxyphenol hydroxylase-like FAD-dependent oxidoreductase
MPYDYKPFPTRRPRPADRGRGGGAGRRGHRGRRAHRAGHGHRPGAAGRRQRGAGRQQRGLGRQPRDLLGQADAGDLRPARRRAIGWSTRASPGRSAGTFTGTTEVWSFDLLPEDGHKMPAFINLQQYYVEEYLVERARDFPDLIDLRFKNKVTSVTTRATAVAEVETPDGTYRLEAEWLLACDGAGSPIREALGLEFRGAAVRGTLPDRRHRHGGGFPGRAAVLVRARPSMRAVGALAHAARRHLPHRPAARLGRRPRGGSHPRKRDPAHPQSVGDKRFPLEWVSVYTFQCRRLDRFVHDRVIFCGDSAHVVSPFGARGGNGGIQDVDNLGWKLAAVCRGRRPPPCSPPTRRSASTARTRTSATRPAPRAS